MQLKIKPNRNLVKTIREKSQNNFRNQFSTPTKLLNFRKENIVIQRDIYKIPLAIRHNQFAVNNNNNTSNNNSKRISCKIIILRIAHPKPQTKANSKSKQLSVEDVKKIDYNTKFFGKVFLGNSPRGRAIKLCNILDK